MLVSLNWLNKILNKKYQAADLADQLTLHGLEVDTVKPALPEFSGVIVAQITDLHRHPDADRLNVCQVFDGKNTVEVVCGGVNVRKDLKVPFATVGAVLPGDFKIKKSKLRGVVSNGMICATQEIGLPEAGSHEIMELREDAPLGADFREYYQAQDFVLDIELTPNRGDCASMLGVAREVAAENHLPLPQLPADQVAATIKDTLSVKVKEAAQCPSYCGRVVKNIRQEAQTPLWMQIRLERAGVRCIHPVVDVLNYVMIETGQPMHAFDLEQLDKGIEVRLAKKGEKLKLLDEQEIELKPTNLVIADHSNPIALAGVMGGLESGVTDKTKNVFLECAYFSPSENTLNARAFHLNTDAAYRYARGVDPTMQQQVLDYASFLLQEVVGGEYGPVSEVISDKHLPKAAEIKLTKAKITNFLGLDIADEQVESLLQGEGLELMQSEADYWVFKAPSWRSDLQIEADVLEEVVRLYGYDKLPTTQMKSTLALGQRPEDQVDQAQLKQFFCDRDYSEVITYSFVDEKLQEQLAQKVEVKLLNPIASDLAVMRTSLWPGLVKVAQYNLRHQQSRVRIFEIAKTYHHFDNAWQENMKIAGLITGGLNPAQWQKTPEADFFSVKADVDAWLSHLKIEYAWRKLEHHALHPGQSAGLFVGEDCVGTLGRLHPALQSELDFSQPIYLFEFALEALIKARLPKFSPVSKYPSVRRDLAVVLDEKVPAGEVLSAISQTLDENLAQIEVFDVYQGEGIEKNAKSLGLGLIFCSSYHTLIEAEVNGWVEQVIDLLQKQFKATIRV